MHIFHPNSHRLHAPAWYLADGTTRKVPECPERMDRILDALKPLPNINLQGSHQITLDPFPAIRATHTAPYLDYLRTIHALWHAEFNCDVIPDTFPRPRSPCSSGARPPKKPSAQAGYFCFDMAAPITAGTFDAVVDSTRCAVAAAERILQGDRTAFALVRPPGHHAGADYCGGFCFLNNAAIAAQHLLTRGMNRVAILDVDYHHGNGTQDIFYNRRDVLFVSLHAEPDTQYPYFWGHADETGEGEGKGFNLNLPLPRGTTESTWFNALDTAITRVRDFKPDAIVVSLGVDTYENDDVGDFNISLPGFKQLGQRLAQLPAPLTIIQEGGYNLEAVGPCVAATLQGILAQ